MSGSSSRRKGAAFERLVVRLLHLLGYENAERNLEYQAKHAGHDVHYGINLASKVSCKCGNQVPLSVYSWLLSLPPKMALVKQVDGYTIWFTEYASGNGWIAKAIGKCDELWCKRSGDWPIVVVKR